MSLTKQLNARQSRQHDWSNVIVPLYQLSLLNPNRCPNYWFFPLRVCPPWGPLRTSLAFWLLVSLTLPMSLTFPASLMCRGLATLLSSVSLTHATFLMFPASLTCRGLASILSPVFPAWLLTAPVTSRGPPVTPPTPLAFLSPVRRVRTTIFCSQRHLGNRCLPQRP